MRRHPRVLLVVRMSMRAVSLETVLDGEMVWAPVHVLVMRCRQDALLGQEGSAL